VIIISTRTNTRKAQNIGLSLRKLGIKVSQKYANFTTTGTITQSHVNIYWHPDIEIGINPNTPTVLALKYLEESLPYTIVPHNEYITDDGPKIEIVLGDDMDSFFPFVTPTYYLPAPPPQIVSGESLTWTGVSKPNRTSTSSNPAIRTSENTQKSAPVIENNTTPIQPGEWEDFGDS